MADINITLAHLNKEMYEQLCSRKNLEGSGRKLDDGTYSVTLNLFKGIDNKFAIERMNCIGLCEYASYSDLKFDD